MRHEPENQGRQDQSEKRPLEGATKAKAREAAALSDKTMVETRAKAYADMEPHVSDLVSMGTIAMELFDNDKRRRRSHRKRNRQRLAALTRRLKR